MAELINEATDQVQGHVGSMTEREERSEVCEPCRGDNDIQPATGWCKTCDEMLCQDCYKAHCRPKMMKNHQLWTLQEMRKRNKTKKIENKCKTHEGKMLEYFCEDHAELGCSQCFVTKHRPCGKVVSISEVITSESNEFRTMQLLLSQLEKRLNILEEKKERNLSITGRHHEEVIVVIQEAGQKLKTLIDTLVKAQITQVATTKDDNIRTIGEVDKMKKEVEEQLVTARDMLAAVKEDNNQLFITMKHLQVETKVLESKLGDSEQKNTIKEYEFVLNPELARLLDTVTELGTLKGTRELDMDKATDELGDELEVRRFHARGRWYDSNGRPDAIQMSTDRDTRLLYVLLYPCFRGDTNVELSIKEGSRCLISCTSTRAKTAEEFVVVKVVGGGGVHGITLQAGHRYNVVVTITGCLSYYGRNGLSEVTMHGVKFSFSKSNMSSDTNVTEGRIPGFRFSLM